MRPWLWLGFGGLALIGLACNTNSTAAGPPLPVPTGLSSISLNQAIDLAWNDDSYSADPNRFGSYQVYSTSYSLGTDQCGTNWTTEGSTVAPEFLAAALTNGVPRCYAVTSLTSDGVESALSTPHADTPRPDARNVLLYAYPVDSAQSGFRFWTDLNRDGIAQSSELGFVTSGNDTTVDFVVDRHGADSSLWVIPVFSGTTMRQYGVGPLPDLTSIDVAPPQGYSADSAIAQPGYGYVFQIIDGPVVHYAAIRLTHVGRQYLIFDWSFQTDPGNPELQMMHHARTVLRP
jgi:hypothetical protein